MENKNLGSTNEKERENIANEYKDVVGGATPTVIPVISAVTAITKWVCPSGACTSSGYCGK